MEKSTLITALRKELVRNGIFDKEYAASAPEHEIINTLLICPSCGESHLTETQLNWILEQADSMKEVYDLMDRCRIRPDAKIHYLIGDATDPWDEPAIIAHICNDAGRWGSGFVVPLGNKYPIAKKAYTEITEKLVLGRVQFVFPTENICVANMIAQHGIISPRNTKPIKYDALYKCLDSMYIFAERNETTVHIPRIGCNRAGGTWEEVKSIIDQTIRVPTYVYTLENERENYKGCIYEARPDRDPTQD